MVCIRTTSRVEKNASDVHTLFDDGGVRGLPRVALDEPQTQRFLPGRLCHDKGGAETGPEEDREADRVIVARALGRGCTKTSEGVWTELKMASGRFRI